jgi:hypothetical protein
MNNSALAKLPNKTEAANIQARDINVFFIARL